MGKEARSRMRRSLGVIVIALAGLGIFGLMMEQTDAPRSAGQTSAHAAALDAANIAFEEGDFATAAATLDGLATGSLNPGVRGRYFRVYRVSQDRLARAGWFLRFADRTELPVN